MSWLGGSLSSITGQISNLTKDILTEGTEETTDTGTELRIAQEKNKDFQNVIATLNSENEHLKQLNHDLEEKAESSELQINTISQQYRQVLEEKQAEIKKLKEDHNELLQHQSTSDYGQHQNTDFGEYNPQSSHGARDDLDFSDSITMQHEINRLRKECHRLQSQCDQLKSSSKSDVNISTDNKHQKEIEDLQKKLKETSQQLATEKENHQNEVASLQDLHSQKASILRKKFRDEITQYKQKISQLEQTGEEGQKHLSVKESAEYLQLEEKLKSLEHDQNLLKHDHEIVCKELKHAKNQLLDQLDSNHAQSLELLGDLREFRRHLGCEMINRRDKLLEEKQYFIQEIIDSAKQQRELNSEINDLENEQDRVFSEADSMVTDLGNEQHQKSTSEIFDNIEKENLLMKKKNLELQEQVVILEKSVQTLTEEKKRFNTDDVDQLHQQITSYQEEIQQFDAIKSDLQSEKEALEGVLVDLRGLLKEKENDLKQVNNELTKRETDFETLKKEKDQLEKSLNESQLEMSQTEFVMTTLNMEKEELQKSLDQSKQLMVANDDSKQLREKLAQKTQQLDEVASEKIELETSMEELDAQHQEAMNQVIDIRNDLFGKVENLQSKVQELDEIRNKLTEQIESQKSQIKDLTEARDGLTSKAESQESQIQDLIKARDQMIEDDQSHEVQKLVEAKDCLQEEVQSLETQVREANESRDCLQAQLDREQKEWLMNRTNEEQNINELKIEINQKEKKITDLEKHVTMLQKENGEKTELLRSFEDKDKELQEISDERDQLVQDLEDKNKSILLLERKIEEKQENITAIEEKYNFVNEQLQQGSEAEASGFLQKISDLQNILSEKEEMIHSLKSQSHDLTLEKEKLEVVVNKLKEERKINDQKFNEMKDKLSNGAMTINNLHMDIKEMKENLSDADVKLNDKSQNIKHLRKENESFKQTLKEIRDENDSLKQSLESLKKNSQELTLSDDIVKLKSSLETKTKEVMTLSEKCSHLTGVDQEFSDYKLQTIKQLTDLNKTLDKNQEEISNYKEKISLLQLELEEYKEEITIQKVELDEKVKDLVTENLSLENNVKHLQETLDEKIQYYKNIIKELESGCDLNDTISEENKNLIKLNIEKDTVITNLNDEIKNMKTLLSENEKLTENSSVDFVAKVQTISDLKQDVSDLSAENEHCQSKIHQQIAVIEELQNAKEKLQVDIQNLTSKLESVAAEYTDAVETISTLQNEIGKYQSTIEDQKSGIILLNDRCQGHLQTLKDKESQITNQEGMLAIFRHASVEKDQHIDLLNKRIKRAVSLIADDQQQFLDMDDVQPNYSLPAIEYPEKGSLEQVEKQQEVREEMVKLSANKQESGRDFDETESRDVISDMESLQSLIKQKDDVINELQCNNSSLLKMLETKSVSNSDKTVVDIHRLENEVRNLKIEREQIMAVMNEKSREASSLKSEVHRLMNTVAAEKSAIDKLQKDMIQSPGSGDQEDMQKQALQNLSRLVRDKDLEIEALKQKNETLLTVLQDSSSNGTEITTLMQDKENLVRQLKVFQDERDQMVTFVNQKHEESLKYHQEVQRLTQYINSETDKHNRTQQDYASLVPQFEDKKQALLKTQNELINYKQKYTELEVKYGEMVQKVNTSDTVDIGSYNTQAEELKHSQEKLKELNESLQETEQKVTLLHQQNVEYEEEILRRDAELSGMKKQVDTLTFQLQGAEGELSDLKQEHSLSEKETSEQMSYIQMMKETNNRLTLELQDREFEIKTLSEKSQTLTSIVDGQKDEEGQLNKLLKENESVMAQVKGLQQERHQTIMALKQRQIESQELQRECHKLKDKEAKYIKELERLRGHLLQMEEAYTKDALESEEREKDLRNRLAVAEEKVLSSTSAVQSASQHAIQQVESLQQQLHTVASQRDQAYLQLSSLQDQCQQYAVSLSNLQLVLEQFQRDKDGQVAGEVEKYQRENEKLQHSVTDMSRELEIVKEKLLEAEDGLEAASRLHQQLDKCDQIIAALKEEVQIREATLKNAEVEISDLRNAKDSKVDKMIIKSMILGYFTAPKNKQDDVLHTIGSVLNFSPTEFEKVLGGKSTGGWMPGFLRFGGMAATPPTTPTRRHTVTAADTPDRSFSELFVKFLETESSPKQPVMKLPAEEMALDVQRHHKPAFNPFTAPRHVNQEDRSARDEHHLLMPSTPLSTTLPVFSPIVESSRPKTSSAILNDVLSSS